MKQELITFLEKKQWLGKMNRLALFMSRNTQKEGMHERKEVTYRSYAVYFG